MRPQNTFTRQTLTEERQLRPPHKHELPPSTTPHPTHSIYVAFTSYATCLLQILFTWRSSGAILRKQHAPPIASLSLPPLDDPMEAWKIQRLMDRRKQEAGRMRCMREMVRVEVCGSAEKRKRDELSDDEEPTPLPIDRFVESAPWPRFSPPLRPCATTEIPDIPKPKIHFAQEERMEPFVLSRSTSPCSSRGGSRSASPWPSEDTVWGSDSDSEADVHECMMMLLDDD
ncbi:hypothetical protein C8R46DRAFT_197992 [Mycena filopes]|nr:hypothetical protein C8R46DRAFT_197992 [Mycena filopes]